jgi:putative transposase
MGQSLVKNYVHIVFSTKYRQPLITENIETQLWAYMSGICNEMQCPSLQVGGYIDHIHILCRLSQKIALMKLLEEVKGHSSKWIKTQDEQFANFYWQNGYGAFSVQPNQVEIVRNYILNQKTHHAQKMTFQGEYRAFLKKYNIEYDEKYVWD